MQPSSPELTAATAALHNLLAGTLLAPPPSNTIDLDDLERRLAEECGYPSRDPLAELVELLGPLELGSCCTHSPASPAGKVKKPPLTHRPTVALTIQVPSTLFSPLPPSPDQPKRFIADCETPAQIAWGIEHGIYLDAPGPSRPTRP